MSDFRTLLVEEAIAWIRAWTDHAWPITLQEAFIICDSLGWKQSLRDPTFFTTKLSTNGKEDCIIFENNELKVKRLHFNLSSIYSFDDNEQINHTSQSAYSQYVTALRGAWGPGRSSNNDGVSEVRWTLPSKVSISIFGMNGLVSIDIDSPQRTQLKENYDRIIGDDG